MRAFKSGTDTRVRKAVRQTVIWGTSRDQTAAGRPARRFATQAQASLNYDILAPILLGAGAVAGAWLSDQLRSKTAVSKAAPAADGHTKASIKLQQQQEQQEKLTALIQKQKQQIDTLTRDKQRLQQEAKKQTKAQDKVQNKLTSSEQALLSLQAEYAAVSVELLQVRGELDQANKQIYLLRQREAELSSQFSDIHTHHNGNSSSIAASPQPAAAAKLGTPLRIAFVGGRNLKDSQRRMLPPNAEVYMITRWNGHGTTQWVTKLCKGRSIPVYMLDSTQIARAKGRAAAAAASESDWSDGESSS
eukprot:GHUV01014674.1.p1 GENE.GHUV01014674.1~~GHUV01014674.1.p1  ORF type:complete len:304 (+),score=109.08 GHUV01014674.1:379-1290(+)